MRSILLSAALLFTVIPFLVSAQPQLSVSVDIPAVTVDVSVEDYVPRPLPVTATIYNTGASASAPLTARISLLAGLSLDSAEQSAMIKTPAPAVVPPGDSAKVTWNIRIAPTYKVKNYRVYVWLKYGASDSLQTSQLLTVPAMDPPDLLIMPTSVSALTLRPDSLGYQPNPFDVNVRFSNAGGTTADSVSLELLLPPDYELDPATQENPRRWSGPFAPQAAGGPREYFTWKVRYTGATRQQRDDTLRLRARGKNGAGEWMEFHAQVALTVEGMAPRFLISWQDPGAMQYDTASIYRPHPYPLILRLTNDSEQWTRLSGVELELFGDGIRTSDPLLQTLPSLSPNSHLDVTWDLEAERRAAPRQVAGEVTVADAEGKTKSGVRIVAVPGQPFALTVRDVTAPDSLARNAAGTALLTTAVPISFTVRNDTWYNSTVTHARVQSLGQGIDGPPWREHAPGAALRPGETSAAIADTFVVQPMLADRVISIQLLAVSDRGDTARGMHAVRIPGVQPLLQLTRSGPERLDYQPGTGYVPNPFAQVYTLRNLGTVTVRVDSIVLAYRNDGVQTPQPLRRDIGWDLAPGDSLVTRWDFSAAVRDTLRRLPFTTRAYFAREHQLVDGHVLEIPGLAPVIDATVSGPDTLAYDPDSLYDPNPFTISLRVRNAGNASLLLDSVALAFDDPLVTPVTATVWTDGAEVRPGEAITFDWTLRADAHDTAKDLDLRFTLHHAGGKRAEVSSRVFIPALRPGLEVILIGNEQLLLDEDSIYRPDPFIKTMRIENTGTADLQVDSAAVDFTDPLLGVQEGRTQMLLTTVGAGEQMEVTWHFRTAPHFSQGYVLLDFTLYHSGGESLLIRGKIYVPGEPFAFALRDVQMPDRLEPMGDGQGYENNPVVLRYTVDNAAWFTTLFTRAEVALEGQGVQMLTQQPSAPSLLLAPRERSAVQRDSFFVLPASFDRTVRVLLSVAGDRGFTDQDTLTLFVPRIVTTAVEDAPRAGGFAIDALYPNPLRTGAAVLNVRMRSSIPYRWEVVDLLGRKLRQSAAAEPSAGGNGAGTLRIDCAGLPQGRYILRVLSAEGVRTQGFVILD